MTDGINSGSAGNIRSLLPPPAEVPAEQVGNLSSRDQTMLVEELASPDDYWLSITDAARVTRRQEITIRRWISAGTLPVRGQRMGLNKRTRHVRASDLARLTPIIDPTAAITGAPAQVNLLSIPEQQAHLLAEQQRVAHQVADLSQRAEDSEKHVANLHEHAKAVRHEAEAAAQTIQTLQALTQHIATRIDALAEELTKSQQDHTRQGQRVEGIERALNEIKAGLTALTKQSSATEQTASNLSARIDQIATLAELAAHHEDQLATIRTDFSTLHTRVSELDTRSTHLLQQTTDQAKKHTQQHDAAMQAVQQLHAEMEQIAQQTTNLNMLYQRQSEAQAASEQHARLQDELLAALQASHDQLHEEIRHARRSQRLPPSDKPSKANAKPLLPHHDAK